MKCEKCFENNAIHNCHIKEDHGAYCEKCIKTEYKKDTDSLKNSDNSKSYEIDELLKLPENEFRNWAGS